MPVRALLLLKLELLLCRHQKGKFKGNTEEKCKCHQERSSTRHVDLLLMKLHVYFPVNFSVNLGDIKNRNPVLKCGKCTQS